MSMLINWTHGVVFLFSMSTFIVTQFFSGDCKSWIRLKAIESMAQNIDRKVLSENVVFYEIFKKIFFFSNSGGWYFS